MDHKCDATTVFDDPLPSPTMSTSSLLSQCPETINSEPDYQTNQEQLPSSPSPTKVPELLNEPKDIVNNVTYDYLPKGKISYYFLFCTYVYFTNSQGLLLHM